MSRDLKIFRSDREFILFFANILLFGGFFSLFVALFCRILHLEICRELLVPMFGGFDVIRHELALFNLPLAMIIIGIGLRLFSPFGWFTCLALGSVLALSFGYLAFLLGNNLDIFVGRVAQNTFSFSEHPVIESMFVNGLLALICSLFVIYLALNSTRSLYFIDKKSSKI